MISTANDRKFKTKGRKFCKNFEITITIHSNSERSEQFLNQNTYLLLEVPTDQRH